MRLCVVTRRTELAGHVIFAGAITWPSELTSLTAASSASMLWIEGTLVTSHEHSKVIKTYGRDRSQIRLPLDGFELV